MSDEDPLAALVIDTAELDRARIATVLRGRIAIDRANSVPVVQPPFNEWDTNQKILGFLLARKAMALLGVDAQEAAMPNAIAGLTGLAAGTVRPTLRGLLQQRRVSQDSKGAYLLSAPQVNAAIEALAVAVTVGDRLPAAGAARTRHARGRVGKGRGEDMPRHAPKSPGAGPDHPKPMKPPSRSSGGSPSSLVKGLIAQGFFDSPRTLNSVQKHLKDKAGRQIPITTLSPLFTRLLRSNVLDREETDEGAYAYEKPKG